MIRIKHSLAAIALIGLITAGAGGIASAASGNNANHTIGTSTIPVQTFRTDREQAEATVLKTTPAAIRTAKHDKTLHSLIAAAGLTDKTYREQVKAALTKQLQGQGYSQDEITIALQHREISRLRHADK